MIKDRVKVEMPNDEELIKRLAEQKEKLAALQIKIKEAKIPVMVICEGWGTAGKGSILGKIIHNLDPRFFKVGVLAEPTEDEKRKPFLYRYFTRIPEAGQFAFLESGWMEDIVKGISNKSIEEEQYKKKVKSINRFERQLTDNGYLVLKIFFQISEKEQKKRIEKLEQDKSTRWRVSEYDKWQNKHYDKCLQYFDTFMEETNASTSPWYVVDATQKKWAQLQVLELINQGIDTALQNHAQAVPILQNQFPLKKMPKLADIKLNKKLSQEKYEQELDRLTKRLSELHNELYRRKIPVIVCYEGWDAAGKGGNIKRLTGGLDPRGYEVFPIASPEPHEKARHYLWRFFNRLPRSGHVAVFDRTWYGRVMVERLEGFCSENDWKRAYNEMNEFEQELVEWGAIVVKFWVQIDKDTQLERFTERQNTPEKQWKITDEDWRNREKWDLYEAAIDEMIQKTSTTYAPWHILESNDKKYARIKALKILIEEIEKKIG